MAGAGGSPGRSPSCGPWRAACPLGRRDPKTAHYCCICQRDINPKRPYRLVHWLDCDRVLHPGDEAAFAAGAPLVDDETGATFDRQEDFGEQKIGMDCARKLGLEWSRAPVKQEPAAPVESA